MPSQPLPPRAALDRSETWALEHLFSSQAAFEGAMREAEGRVRALAAYRGRLGDDARTLHAFLAELSDLTAAVGRLRPYAMLPVAADGGDGEARRALGAFAAVASRWRAETAFVEPELLAIGSERLAAFRSEEPELARFAPFLARLEEDRPFVRSAEVEDVLALAAQPLDALYRVQQALVAGDLRFEGVHAEGRHHEVAPSTIRALERDADREVRRQAFVSYADGHLAFADTLAELYLMRVQAQAFEARVRAHASGEAAALAGMRVPTSVLDATIAAFTRRLPVWHRYWAVRQRLLGVARLEPWDVHASLGRRPPGVPFEQAVAWIVASSAPLGEAYAERLRRGLLHERWVDRRPNRGKREGAFCASAPGVHPYILMSYVDDLPSASTLAHELGHAMHALLVDEAQDPLDGVDELSMTVAETASNAQQALLRDSLLAGSARDERDLELAVLDEAMGNFHRYLFVMPTLVRFERHVHGALWRDEALTGDDLTGVLRDLFQQGYGDALVADDRVGSAWAQFGHLYVPFYTFQYAVGIAAATALVARIAAGEQGAAADLRAFMAAGPSRPPVDLFASVGLDVTTPEPIERAFDVVEGYVTRLEELAG
jgi:oligoendopeptidase F